MSKKLHDFLFTNVVLEDLYLKKKNDYVTYATDYWFILGFKKKDYDTVYDMDAFIFVIRDQRCR